MSKRFAYLILGLVLVVALLSIFVLSPLATPVFRWAANNSVEGIEVEEITGSLYSGLSITSTKINIPGVNISIAEVDIAVDWACTSFEEVCISQLTVDKPQIELIDSQNPDESTTSSNVEKTLISSPVMLNVHSIQVLELALESAVFDIKLGTFDTQLSFADKLLLTDTDLSELTFTSLLPPSPPQPFRGISYSVPELPDIWIPIDAHLDGFKASDLAFISENSQQRISVFSFSHLWVKGKDIEWDELVITHEQGQAQSTGEITLLDTFPLNLSLAADASVAESQSQQIDLTATGSLSQLNVVGKLSGLVTGSAELELALLDESLPINGRISWPKQNVNHPQLTTIDEGLVDVSGEMGNYALKVNSAATLKSIERVAVKADVVLTESSLTVNQLDAELLSGHVQTQGNINFVDGLNGTGATQINDIDATVLFNNGKQAGVPKASWQYQIQQSNSGINLLLTDLSADVIYDKQQANISGQAVYAQAQDLVVASLAAVQKDTDNAVKIVAQVLNQRVINVNSDISIPELSAILADVEGDITGKVTVKGEWSNPQFSVDLDTQGITVAENLSAPLHQQGVLTASLHGGGKLSSHDMSLAVNLADYKADIDLQGSLEQQKYQSQINSSNLSALDTNWQLASPILVTYDLEQQSANIGSHCWNLKQDEGELCLNKVSYSDNTASWDVLAKQLPIGKWATQTVEILTQTSDSARFEFISSGSFSPNNGLVANADFAITPSTWTINKDNPVSIALDTLDGQFFIDKKDVKVSTAFASTELGKINLELSGSSQNWFSNEVNGKLLLDNIQLQPLAKVSPSIYKLNGVINGEIAMTGNARKPHLDGELTVRDGVVDIEQSPLALANWNQIVYFNGQQADIEGEFLLGDGDGSLFGILSWRDEPYAKLRLDANQIAIEHEDIKLAVSPDLETHIDANEIVIEGDINIPKARIKISALPENAITPSKDVYLRGEPESTDPIKNIIADINLHIDENKTKNVKLDAFGLTANLHGQLQIKNQPSTVGYGDLQILDGRYKAYGQNLIIQTGEVQFNGPIGQPFLFVEAIRNPELTADGVIAGVRIEGAASKPTVSLFSEPAMEQSQNLLYLINGAGNLNGGSSSSEDYQAALVGFGLSRSGSVTGSIGEALGIEDLNFSTTGQGDNTQVSMTGNINDRLSVRFGVGLFGSSQEVAIRYQLLPQLYVEAIQRLSDAVSLIDLYYEFSLGDPSEMEQKENNQ